MGAAIFDKFNLDLSSQKKIGTGDVSFPDPKFNWKTLTILGIIGASGVVIMLFALSRRKS